MSIREKSEVINVVIELTEKDEFIDFVRDKREIRALRFNSPSWTQSSWGFVEKLF